MGAAGALSLASGARTVEGPPPGASRTPRRPRLPEGRAEEGRDPAGDLPPGVPHGLTSRGVSVAATLPAAPPANLGLGDRFIPCLGESKVLTSVATRLLSNGPDTSPEMDSGFPLAQPASITDPASLPRAVSPAVPTGVSTCSPAASNAGPPVEDDARVVGPDMPTGVSTCSLRASISGPTGPSWATTDEPTEDRARSRETRMRSIEVAVAVVGVAAGSFAGVDEEDAPAGEGKIFLRRLGLRWGERDLRSREEGDGERRVLTTTSTCSPRSSSKSCSIAV